MVTDTSFSKQIAKLPDDLRMLILGGIDDTAAREDRSSGAPFESFPPCKAKVCIRTVIQTYNDEVFGDKF